VGKLIPFDAATRRTNQDAFLDLLVSGQLPHQHPSLRPNPLSLRPDELLMLGCAIGDPTACSIRDSWKFQAPITVMAADELDELSVRCHTTFCGREGE
jgi:hypothetical protein